MSEVEKHRCLIGNHPNSRFTTMVRESDYDLLAAKLAELKQAFEESQAEVVSRGMKLAECQKCLDLATENAARAVYSQWSKDPEFVPWVDRGNSMKQDDARMIARAFLSTGGGRRE